MTLAEPHKPGGTALTHPLTVFVAVALTVVSYVFGQTKGLAGFGLGIAAISVSMFGTYMAVKFVGRIMESGTPPWSGAAVPVAAMVIKLPVLLGAMSWALRLGPPAPAWFLAGLGLVYSVTVWWAVSRR